MWPSRDSFHFSALREFCERLGSSAPDGMAAQYALAPGKTGPLLGRPQGFVLDRRVGILPGRAYFLALIAPLADCCTNF
jgi:hypothetical protein